MIRGQLDVYDVLEPGRVPRLGEDLRDASLSPAAGAGATGRVCDWCRGPIPEAARVDAEVCGVVCRKRRWRFRRAVERSRGDRAAGGTRPVELERRRPAHQVGPAARFAYADPPYPGKAGLYPECQEVDHRELIAELEVGYPDGWALSTSAAALWDVLPLCPRSVRVCAWRRAHRGGRSRRPLSAWEPLLVVGGRELPVDEPQTVLDALDYRGRYDAFPGALVGMKPPEFAVWLFQQLGARAGDELADLFPGSGAIGRAWALYTSPEASDVARDGSLGDAGDASPAAAAVVRDASARGLRDASRATVARRHASAA